jgi:hypothetical protein
MVKRKKARRKTIAARRRATVPGQRDTNCILDERSTSSPFIGYLDCSIDVGLGTVPVSEVAAAF